MRRGTEALLRVAALVLTGCPGRNEAEVKPAPSPVVAALPAPDAAVEMPQSDAGPAPQEQGPASVLRIAGDVRVQRHGSDEWVVLSMGDVIRAGDRVRTSGDGQLDLSLDATRIRLHEESEVLLDAVDPSSVRIKVTGSGEAEVPGGGPTVAFEAGEAVASTDGGQLTLAFDGKNVVAGAVLGGATFTQGGKTVTLKGGEFVVTRAEGPSRPAKIPKKVSLEVGWPEATETNQAQVRLSGRASAYARVFVAGRRVETGPNGQFTATVPLKRGKQTVQISAVDPFGRRAVRSQAFVMDPDAPRIKGAVEYR
jgi:hypothetical protein